MTTAVRFTLVLVLLAIASGQPSLARAYELRTHGEITHQAYGASQGVPAYLQAIGLRENDTFDLAGRTKADRLGLFENPGTARGWMIEGAIREDEYIDNLFLTLLGCPRPANPSETSRILNHFFDVQRGGRGLTGPTGQLGFPAPDWALGRQGRGPGSKENQFSLPDAREYQYQSLTASSPAMRDQFTARFFRTLGHVLHIVEDMAQPQHTRNDPHAGCMDMLNSIVGGHSWYEHYVEDRTLRRAFPRRGEIPPEIVLTGYNPVTIRPYQDFFTDPDRRGIADFSSRNFLSAGTNLGTDAGACGGLIEPPCEVAAYQKVSRPFSTTTLNGTVSGLVTLYTRDVVDALTGQVIPSVPLSSRSVWDQHLQTAGSSEKFTLNRLNYDAMADILLPRAVGYAAGFLDAFFRGFLIAGYENDKLTISGSVETMVGDFKVLYDKADGTRAELASWTALRVEPDEVSPALSVPQLPEDAAPGAPCWLIFRGQLGLEADAVVGSQVPCPAPPLPPLHGRWTLYRCFHQVYGAPTSNFFYSYATDSPPLASDGLPAVIFFRSPPTGVTTCSLQNMSMAEQPPNSLTEHPV